MSEREQSRSAETGQWVTGEAAATDKDRTVTETVRYVHSSRLSCPACGTVLTVTPED